MIDLDDVARRVQSAEYAAIHVNNTSAMWAVYYSDGIKSSKLISDFLEMTREIKELRDRLYRANDRLEGLGGKGE